ncbi:MAG: serine/threonine-protein kinase [Byssovorax sp.]
MSFLARVRSFFSSGPHDAADPAGDGAARGAAGSDAEHETATHEARAAVAGESGGTLPQIQRLAEIGARGGPTVDEAIGLLRRVRGTVHEAPAVMQIQRAIEQRAVPEPVKVACADLLAARGDEGSALRVLEGTTSTPGLILAADLHAAGGQLARAVGTIERVLARELDAPGARERHLRWTSALGVVRRDVRRLDEATVVAASPAGGPYRLLREIARGGAGAVYEAEDSAFGRRIAFKVYHRRGADQALLEHEARTAAALAGPGILRIYDADPSEGWIALEWVPRGSVRDILRAGDLAPLAPVARWARPLARALARVHAEGLVHADVKPANVLLRQPHDAILGDFGIARPIGAPGEGGSAGYVSPERIAGRASHPRDDVYGYGRVIEDVIHRLEAASISAGDDVEVWRALALACIGPDEGRPDGGAELLQRLP